MTSITIYVYMRICVWMYGCIDVHIEMKGHLINRLRFHSQYLRCDITKKNRVGRVGGNLTVSWLFICLLCHPWHYETSVSTRGEVQVPVRLMSIDGCSVHGKGNEDGLGSFSGYETPVIHTVTTLKVFPSRWRIGDIFRPWRLRVCTVTDGGTLSQTPSTRETGDGTQSRGRRYETRPLFTQLNTYGVNKSSVQYQLGNEGQNLRRRKDILGGTVDLQRKRGTRYHTFPDPSRRVLHVDDS